MTVEAQYEIATRRGSDLPSERAVIEAAKAAQRRFDAALRAPTLDEDYSGPVLFVGTAAAEFFLQTVGEPLSAPRDPDGQQRPGRMTDRLGKRVAARTITVRDDPTQVSWNGQPLIGHFPVDDDGVLPKPITLVEKGVLKTYYMSRVPTTKVSQTNGHSRNGTGSVGNLFVETTQPESRAKLKARLIELAADEDLEYGLMIEQLGSPKYQWSMRERAFLPPPIVAYRVFPDGREEPVRGLQFKAANPRVLKDIAGMGDDPTLLNTRHRQQNVSVVAPSVLVKLLDVQKPTEELDQPPLVSRP